MSTPAQKRCKRHGCLKHYNEEENQEGSCHFHPGQPIFHDLKKGWTCCNRIVYDWDEFQKLPTCATGTHTDQKELAQQFYQSSTVKNATNALKKEEPKPAVIKDINQYNKGKTGAMQNWRKRRSRRKPPRPTGARRSS
jgi:hypothetical protein